MSAITVAFVNARATRANALAAERRQYQRERLRPFLEFVSNRAADSTQMNVRIHEKDWPKARALLAQMDQQSFLQFSSALGVAMSDPVLSTFAEAFVNAEQTFRAATRAVLHDDAGGLELRNFRKARMRLLTSADQLHGVTQIVLFNTDRWWRRYVVLVQWWRRSPFSRFRQKKVYQVVLPWEPSSGRHYTALSEHKTMGEAFAALDALSAAMGGPSPTTSDLVVVDERGEVVPRPVPE